MTGTDENAAKRSTRLWPNVRIMMISTMADITRALSSIGSPGRAGCPWGEKHGVATHLRHAGLERHARARRGLLENHAQDMVLKRSMYWR